MPEIKLQHIISVSNEEKASYEIGVTTLTSALLSNFWRKEIGSVGSFSICLT